MIPPLLFAACTPPISDYQLTLVPHFVEDDVLADSPDVKLILRYPDGVEEVYGLGTAAEGTAFEMPNLPPLPAGTAVGLAFGEPNPLDPDVWSRPATRAYGEVVLDEALATGEVAQQLDVLVLGVQEVTRLGKLADADRRIGGAAVITADRHIYVFGGGDPGETDMYGFGVGRDTVLSVAPTVDGWSAAKPLGTRLPSYNSGPSGLGETALLAGASAVYVDTASGPRIFLFGGRPSLFNTGGSTSRVLEFDPATETFDDREIEIIVPRSQMLAYPLGANKILLYGGLASGGLPVTASYEIFSIATRSSTPVLSTNNSRILGNYGACGTTLGSDVAICSGARLEGPFLTPVDQCFVITAADEFFELPALPEPLFGAALAALPDGALLISGGTSESLQGDDLELASAPSSARAYRLDEGAQAWTPVGDLLTPRAHHRAVALGDGRVMIVGGTAEAAFLYAATGSAVLDTEVFDPFTNQFERTGSSLAGSGQDPELVGPATGPWVLLEGGSEEATFAGGGAYGVLGTVPAR